MKSVELITMALIAMGTMVHLAPSSVTRPATSAFQAPQVDHEEQSAEKQTPKNVFVNVRVFFEKHWRAKQLRSDFDRALAQQEPKGKKLQMEIQSLLRQLRETELSPSDAAKCQGLIKAHNRAIEDIVLELDALFEKQRVEITKMLWKDLDHGIKAMSEAYGLRTIVRVGAPDEFWSHPIYQSRSSMPVYDDDLAPPGFVDITEHVLSTVTPACCFPEQKE